MPATPTSMPHRRDQAFSERSPWVVGAPDILLIVLASLSLWALVAWAIIGYF